VVQQEIQLQQMELTHLLMLLLSLMLVEEAVTTTLMLHLLVDQAVAVVEEMAVLLLVQQQLKLLRTAQQDTEMLAELEWGLTITPRVVEAGQVRQALLAQQERLAEMAAQD
jgi:hypothetical protein